jgi:Na+-transporting NADH:ubiquinone oxidoreductase subunit E
MITFSLLTIFLAAILTHNIALTYLLGMCPFISLSRSLRTATGMGFAVIFVITLTALVNWPIYNLVLVPTGSTLIYYVVFIIVIAATVQLVEMIMERFFPVLQAAFGIFLPLITVNCAILGASLFMVIRQYTFLSSFAYGAGSGIGWALAIIAMSGIRTKMARAKSPYGLTGAGITLVIAGIMALAFIGFTGMIKIS